MTTPWPLAVHAVMLRGLEPHVAVDLVRAHGYQAIFWEFSQTQTQTHDSAASDDAVAQLSHSPIRATCVGFAPDDRNLVAPERAAAIAAAVGAQSVRVVGAPMAGQSYSAAYEATVRLCEAYSRAAQPRGLRVLLHQRWGTLTASASQLQRVLSNFDPLLVGCVYDAGSMTLEGYEEYRIGLEILGDYVADVHIANTRHFPSASRTVWDWEWSPLSDGLLDLQRLFRALRRAGYQGPITLADRVQGLALEALLENDRHILQQAMNDLEGIGSHNPSRPLDDHVDLAERPERWHSAQALAGAHP